MSEEYKKFLNWCEDKWEHDYKMQKLLSKLSNDDKDFLKDQYEARLKADLEAILVELQLEIEEMVNPFGTRISGCSQDGWKHGVKNCDFVIQQKIDKLRGDENEQ